MMVPPGIDPLIARRVGAELDPLDEVQLLELLKGAVDARPADSLEPAVDLERGHRAALAGEQLDHATPGVAAAVARLAQRAQRMLFPTAA